MADAKALPVFGFVEYETQIQHLRDFLREHGAKIQEEGPKSSEPNDCAPNVLEMMKGVSAVGNVESDKEVDMILSSISSLFANVPYKSVLPIVKEFAVQLTSDKFHGQGWASSAGAAVRILSNVFHMFNQLPEVQYVVYEALVKLCGRAKIIGDLDTSVEQLKVYKERWALNTQQYRSLLRLVHAALINDHRADEAAKTMTTLLGTYTDADAASAVDDARECVRTAIVDPKSFSFDHLLRLSAVKLLEKSDAQMYEVLKLFSEGTLKDYKAFAAKQPNFVKEKLQVDEEVLIKKMRLLTLMSMAEKSSVIALSDLSREIDMTEGDELDEFIIESVQVHAITGKINEMKKELIVSSLQHRSFGRPQWELLQRRLVTLIGNLRNAHENIQDIHAVEEKTAP